MQCCHVVATGDMVWYYANYTGKNWISDTVSKIVHLKQDKQDLQDEVDELKKDIQEAYILENDDVLSLNDLRTFYHEHKNLVATMKEHETIRAGLEKDIRFNQMLVFNKDRQIVSLVHEKAALSKEIDALKEDVSYKKQVIDSIEEIARNKENRENLPLIHENQALTKENKALQERVEFLEKERDALNYNMDHAYTLGDGGFLSLDDLCTFYEDNKKIHNVVQQQHNRILLLGLELKQLQQKTKEETFSTMPRQEFEKRAEKRAEAAALKAAENVKFDTYTEGFRKGFDLGYEKAKDQYYE
jgi:peptidoglycan hydrolase CwlO-like protein